MREVCDNSADFECLQVTPRHAIAGGIEGGICFSYRLTVRSRSCTTFGNGLVPPFSPLVGPPLSATCSTSTGKPARTHLPGPRSQESRIFQTHPRSSNHQTAAGYRVSAPLCWVTLVDTAPNSQLRGRRWRQWPRAGRHLMIVSGYVPSIPHAFRTLVLSIQHDRSWCAPMSFATRGPCRPDNLV